MKTKRFHEFITEWVNPKTSRSDYTRFIRDIEIIKYNYTDVVDDKIIDELDNVIYSADELRNFL